MDVVTITESARQYLNQRCGCEDQLVSIKVNNRGCSGHSYEYSVITADKVKKMDEVIRWPGGGICIAAESVMHVLGSTLDLKTTIIESYLVWINPQAVDICGCGTSFALAKA
jgi:iron-sulfur cluster assembly accessory protein